MLLGMRNQGLMSLKLMRDSVKNFGLVEAKVVVLAAEVSDEPGEAR